MINRLIAALKADLEQVTYEEFIYEGSTPTSISLQYNIPLVYEGTDTPVTDISSDGTVSESYTYYIRPSYQNTMALLTELGFYDALPKATDYQAIDVYHPPFYDAAQPNNTVTDPAQIEEIYQYVTTHQPSTAVYRTQPDGSVITLTFQSNTFQEFSVTWSNDDPNMPPSLANLFS